MSAAKADARLTAHATCIIAQDTDLRGEITLGAGCIVHPRATIIAAAGPIIFDLDCVVEENAVILNRRKEVMRIGKGNYFMVGCRIEAKSIGDFNTFKPRSKVSSQVAIADHCTFAPGTVTLPSDPESLEIEVIQPHTVVYGSLCMRRKSDGSNGETERAVRDREREYLREIMPKYNRMRVI